MRINAAGVAYGNPGWLPFYFGFCPTPKVWKKEVARLGQPETPYPDADGACSWFESPKARNDLLCLVTMDERFDKGDPITALGIIAHECQHVWQRVLDHIGEEVASPELEAYSYQAIFEEILQGYAATRKPKFITRQIPRASRAKRSIT